MLGSNGSIYIKRIKSREELDINLRKAEEKSNETLQNALTYKLFGPDSIMENDLMKKRNK